MKGEMGRPRRSKDTKIGSEGHSLETSGCSGLAGKDGKLWLQR